MFLHQAPRISRTFALEVTTFRGIPDNAFEDLLMDEIKAQFETNLFGLSRINRT